MFVNAKGAAFKMAEMTAQMEKQKALNRQKGRQNTTAGRGRTERPPGKPGFLGGFSKKAQANWKSQMEVRKEVFKNVAVAEDDEISGTGSSHCTPRDGTSSTCETTSHTSDMSTLKSVKSKVNPANNNSNNNNTADNALGTLPELGPETASKESDPKLEVVEEDIHALGDSTTQFADLPTFSLDCPVDDDDMTQITMDDSVWGDDSVNLGGSRRMSTMSRDSTDGSVWGDDSVKLGGPRRMSTMSRDSTDGSGWGDDSINFGAVRRVSRDSTMGTLGSSFSGVFSSEDSVLLSKNNGRVHAVQPRRFRREKRNSEEVLVTKPKEVNVDNAQLAQILRKDIWSQEKEVLRNALDRLVEVVKMGSSAQRETIARFGGIASVLRVIDTNDDEKVLLSAYTVLEILSDENQYQITIGELWGIPTICESLARNASNPTIELAGCRTLDAVARCCQDETLHLQQIGIPTVGAVATLGRCLQANPQNRDIQAHAFCAIADLCLGRPLETEELISSGAIGAMAVALTKKWTSKYKKDRAIETMCSLMQSMSQDDDQSEEEEADYTEYATSLKGDDTAEEYQEYAMTLKDADAGDECEDYAITLEDEDTPEGDDYTEYAMTLKDDDTDDFTEYAMTIKGDSDSESNGR